MAVYSYLFTDILTNNVLGDMPLHGVTFDRQLNKAGNFGGSTNLDTSFLSNDDIKSLTTPGRTGIYVYRDDRIVWGGIIWSRTYQSQAKALQISAQTFESYAYRRIYRPSSPYVYNNAQCFIVNQLWQSLQSYSYSNIGVTGVDTLPGGDITRSMTVNPWDFKSYGDIIDGLTNLDDGPDYTIECYESSGVPTRQLMLGYPRLGSIAAYTELLLDYPGNITNYYRTANASENNNQYWATGDGDGAAMVVGVASDSGTLGSGNPLLESSSSYSGVTQQATIDAHAVSDLAAKPLGKIKYSFELMATEEPVFGSYSLGDDARIMIEDPWFPEGIEFTTRTVGWSVTPSSSESTESVNLVLEGDEG